MRPRITSTASDREKKKVLFLCTHNSARSQMAEGLLRAMYADRYEAYSARAAATFVDPRAVQVILEIGIDISAQRSKTAQEFSGTIFDLAITVCDRAKQACPICSTELKLPEGSAAALKISTSPSGPSISIFFIRETSFLVLALALS